MDKLIINIIIFIFLTLLSGITYLAITEPTPDELCKNNFGKQYYHVSGGFSADFCTNTKGDIRYVKYYMRWR